MCATSVVNHIPKKEIWLYIKERTLGRNHMLATFVTDHFRKIQLWLHIKECTQVKNHSSAVIVKKSFQQAVFVQDIHEMFIPNVFKFVTINAVTTHKSNNKHQIINDNVCSVIIIVKEKHLENAITTYIASV